MPGVDSQKGFSGRAITGAALLASPISIYGTPMWSFLAVLGMTMRGDLMPE